MIHVTKLTDEVKSILPAVPDDAPFKLVGTVKNTTPHPYCIDSKHVAIASDEFCGRLGTEAIEATERRYGPCCGMKGCNLLLKDHVTETALVLVVPDNSRTGLQKIWDVMTPWMKTACEALKSKPGLIDGFAMPRPDEYEMEQEPEVQP